MTKIMEEIITKFTPEEQAEIQAEADKLIAEEITLRELKKAYHLTQEEMGKQLGIIRYWTR